MGAARFRIAERGSNSTVALANPKQAKSLRAIVDLDLADAFEDRRVLEYDISRGYRRLTFWLKAPLMKTAPESSPNLQGTRGGGAIRFAVSLLTGFTAMFVRHGFD